MASKIDQQIDAINAARKAAQKRAKNPLTRVKPTSPSMATGKAPTKRLVARRKKTERAPKGVYANPSTPSFVREKVKAPDLPYSVQRWNFQSGEWGTIAAFALADFATAWAKSYHRKFPSTTVRVVDRF